MSTIVEFFGEAELAQAAYANLTIGTFSDADLRSLRDDANMTLTQARQFADNWRVVDQYDGRVEQPYFDEFGQEHTFLNPTGLSVTLFEDGSGNQVVAIRGTNDLNDFITDAIDIAILGTPEFQAQYDALSAQVQKWMANGTLQPGFTVTGHSLGGFLTQALAAEFDPFVSAAYTYNAPGFTLQPGIITNYYTQLLDLLGIVDATLPSDKKRRASRMRTFLSRWLMDTRSNFRLGRAMCC